MRRLLLLILLGIAVYAAWKRFIAVAGEQTDLVRPLEEQDEVPLGDGDLPQGWVAHEPASTS